jgi:hypothetical protein
MTATPCTHCRADFWWSDRWAWRGALAAAPAGALIAILYALLVLRLPPADALLAYGLGALVASGIGCLLAGTLGAAGAGLQHSRRCGGASEPAQDPAREELSTAA